MDCWAAARADDDNGLAGWTWDRRNHLTLGGPLLEPDQRVDMIYASAPPQQQQERCLQPLSCELMRFPATQLTSDHYGVTATLALQSGENRRAPRKSVGRGGSRTPSRSPRR